MTKGAEVAYDCAMKPLFRLHADIDDRVAAIRQAHPDWPCSKGCDSCCRRLAEIPRLTADEWQWLREGWAALPPAPRAAVRNAVANLAGAPKPLVCPFLDAATGSCLVYAHRPVACRTYGFYVERDLGLYCADIEARSAAGALDEVVWGNQEAVERSLHQGGAPRPLTDWFGETAPT